MAVEVRFPTPGARTSGSLPQDRTQGRRLRDRFGRRAARARRRRHDRRCRHRDRRARSDGDCASPRPRSCSWRQAKQDLIAQAPREAEKSPTRAPTTAARWNIKRPWRACSFVAPCTQALNVSAWEACKMKISVTVNGTQYERDVEPRTLLAYFLREDLGLTGTHVGCDSSSCGCCVVALDGDRAVKSCTMFAVQADGHEITTVEGLEQRRQAPSAAASLLGSARTAVRLLHARHDDDGLRAAQAQCRSRAKRRSAKRSPATCAAAPGIKTSSRPCSKPPTSSPARAAQPRGDVHHDHHDREPSAAPRHRPFDEAQGRPALYPRRGRYVDDIMLPGMLYLALVHSPYPHARIKSIDKTAALALPGVKAVITGEDLVARESRLDSDLPRLRQADGARGRQSAVSVSRSRRRDRDLARDRARRRRTRRGRLRAARPVVDPFESKRDKIILRDDRENKTNHIYHWEVGDRAKTDAALADSDVSDQRTRRVSALSSRAARAVRHRRRHERRHGPAHDVSHLAGAARAPHRGLAGHGHSRGQDPHHLARHRRRFRQQGSGLSGLRRRDRRRRSFWACRSSGSRRAPRI